jgi:hypothetical protein
MDSAINDSKRPSYGTIKIAPKRNTDKRSVKRIHPDD